MGGEATNISPNFLGFMFSVRRDIIFIMIHLSLMTFHFSCWKRCSRKKKEKKLPPSSVFWLPRNRWGGLLFFSVSIARSVYVSRRSPHRIFTKFVARCWTINLKLEIYIKYKRKTHFKKSVQQKVRSKRVNILKAYLNS